MDTRTARINTVRGLLRELGLFIPKGASHVVPRVHELVEDAESGLPDALRAYLYEACLEIRELEQRMKDVENQLKALAKQDPAVQRLLTIPGIGLLTATALVGFIGDLKRFRSGRHFASYLGLVPKERSSGNVRRLGRITKHGDKNIRCAPEVGPWMEAEPARRAPAPSLERVALPLPALTAVADRIDSIATGVPTTF